MTKWDECKGQFYYVGREVSHHLADVNVSCVEVDVRPVDDNPAWTPRARPRVESAQNVSHSMVQQGFDATDEEQSILNELEKLKLSHCFWRIYYKDLLNLLFYL